MDESSVDQYRQDESSVDEFSGHDNWVSSEFIENKLIENKFNKTKFIEPIIQQNKVNRKPNSLKTIHQTKNSSKFSEILHLTPPWLEYFKYTHIV